MLMTVKLKGPSGLSYVSTWMAISLVETEVFCFVLNLCGLVGLLFACLSFHAAACLPVFVRLLCNL